MSDVKLTVREIRDVIESEGIGYAIKEYLHSSEISDDKLAKMWKKCADLLNQIEEYVNDDDVLAGEAGSLDYTEDEEDYD